MWRGLLCLYILPAKVLAMTVVDLLWNGAEEASRLLSTHQAPMTKEAYLALLRGLAQESVFPTPECVGA